MAKIIFCFDGTAYSGKKLADEFERSNYFNDDVIRVYVCGCQADQVGNGMIFPDLSIVSKKIKRSFNPNKTIDLSRLRKELGSSIAHMKIPSSIEDPISKIDNIALYGYSRGAVTTFAVAKNLDGLNIPIDIIANQPVPGQRAESSFLSLYNKYNDLKQCRNIKSSLTLLASHNREMGFLRNTFFQQMVAKFSPNTEEHNWLMPHRTHSAWGKNLGFIPFYTYKTLIEKGYASTRPGLDKIWQKGDVSELRRQYEQEQNKKSYYTPAPFAQKIFGADKSRISKEPIYLAWTQNKAKNALSHFGFESLNLSDEQASAIVALTNANAPETRDMIALVINMPNDADTNYFIEMVNYVSEIVNYLAYNTQDNGKTHKSSLIKEYGVFYQQTIFNATYNLIKNPNIAQKDLEVFTNILDNAQEKFEKSALDVDRGFLRKTVNLISNTLCFITSISFIVKILTNQLFLSIPTRSTKLIRDAGVTNTITEHIRKKLHQLKLEDSEPLIELEHILEANDPALYYVKP